MCLSTVRFSILLLDEVESTTPCVDLLFLLRGTGNVLWGRGRGLSAKLGCPDLETRQTKRILNKNHKNYLKSNYNARSYVTVAQRVLHRG